MLSRTKEHFYILNWRGRVAVTGCLHFGLTSRRLVFRNVVWPALTNDH